MEETSAPIRAFARKARFALYALFILSILGWIIPEFLGIGGIDITIEEDQVTIENPNIATGSDTFSEEEFEIPEWFDGFMLLSTFSMLILWFFIVYQIDRLFRSFQAGNFFTKPVSKYIRNIGWIMLLAAVVSSVQEIVDAILFDELMEMASGNTQEGMTALVTSASIDYPILIGALAIMVIARVMGKAVDLQDEMNTVV